MFTTAGKEAVKIEVYPKAVEKTEVLFKSKLRKKRERYFAADNGIVFILTKLPDVLVNDHNRGVNSGRWLLSVVGEGKDFVVLKNQLDPISTFRNDEMKRPLEKEGKDMSDMSYLGEEVTEKECK